MNVAERQYPLYAVVEVRHSDFVDENGTAVLNMKVASIPANAMVTDMFLQVTETFSNSAVSADVLDAPGGASVANVPPPGTGASQVGRAAGGITSGIVGNRKSDITITRTATNDTTGKAYLVVEYVEPNRHNEVQD